MAVYRALQLSMLIAVILTIEFASMLVYATGGKTLRKLLGKSGNVRLLNRIAGTLMIACGWHWVERVTPRMNPMFKRAGKK